MKSYTVERDVTVKTNTVFKKTEEEKAQLKNAKQEYKRKHGAKAKA